MHIAKVSKKMNVIIILLLTIFLGLLGAQLLQSHTTDAETTVILEVDYNNGYTTRYWQWTDWNITIGEPSNRPGYKFIGWMSASGDGHNSSNGQLMFPNPFFDTPHTADKQDNLQLYNNAENGTVTITNVAPDPNLGWASQKNMLKISNTGSARPGLGGFATPIQSFPGGKFYQVVYAKIPVGYTLEFASNSIGDGGTHRFLTSQQGTGNWELYKIYHQSGTTGTFSTCGFFYLDGQAGAPEKPVDWFVAYAGSYNATNAKPLINTIVGGTVDTSVRALWREDSWATNYTVPVKNANGIYEVSKASELGYFAYKARIGEVSDSIMLTKDINLAGHWWVPIGSANNYDFSGKFNGNGYTISNMKNFPYNQNCNGLFGFVDTRSLTGERSIIENVNINNAVVVGKELVGGIAGFAWRAIIRNCTFSGSITGSGAVGGIVGAGYHNTEVSGCLVSANLKGIYFVGGIMGKHELEGTSLKNNYFTGSIVGENNLGGIVGYDIGNAITISNSGVNATLTVDGSDYYGIGGIIGAGTGKITATDSYFVGDIRAVNCSSNTSHRWNGFAGGTKTLVIENVYGRFFTYFNGTLVSANGFMYGITDYTNWNYAPTVNNGLPVPAGLFHIGSLGTQNTYQYLVSLGFAKA